MVARGLAVLEAATRLKVGKTALYAALGCPKLGIDPSRWTVCGLGNYVLLVTGSCSAS